jgi:glutamyl-tRNA synthetase
VGAFGLDRVSKSGAKFDLNKAKWFNQQYIRKTDEVLLASALNKTLQQNSIQAGNEYVLAVCRLVKEKITFISELWTYSHYFFKLPESYDEGVVAKRWNEKWKLLITKHWQRMRLPIKIFFSCFGLCFQV